MNMEYNDIFILTYDQREELFNFFRNVKNDHKENSEIIWFFCYLDAFINDVMSGGIPGFLSGTAVLCFNRLYELSSKYNFEDIIKDSFDWIKTVLSIDKYPESDTGAEKLLDDLTGDTEESFDKFNEYFIDIEENLCKNYEDYLIRLYLFYKKFEDELNSVYLL